MAALPLPPAASYPAATLRPSPALPRAPLGDVPRAAAARWTPIDEPNNEECIAMLEQKGGASSTPGIFHLLDEQCRLAGATDTQFTRKVYELHGANKALGRPRLGGRRPGAREGLSEDEAFVVRHYAGEVSYCTATFLDKNNNVLHADLEEVVLSTTDPFLREVLAGAPITASLASASAASKENVPGAPTAGQAAPRAIAASRFQSVSGQFVRQLGELIGMLRSTNSHFVRCINPNVHKKAGCFDGGRVLSQLRCSGMIEALRLMHAGFPTRKRRAAPRGRAAALALRCAAALMLLRCAGRWLACLPAPPCCGPGVVPTRTAHTHLKCPGSSCRPRPRRIPPFHQQPHRPHPTAALQAARTMICTTATRR